MSILSDIGTKIGAQFKTEKTERTAAINAATTKTAIDALNIDADTLDSVNSTQFLRSDVTDDMTAHLSFIEGARLKGHNSAGNFHLDANSLGGGVTGKMYLNFFSGNGVVFGNGSTGIVAEISAGGNLTVTGTVDGRDIAADGIKLNTIATGATIDQTAEQILTAIKTVDGSGSGLDADTLDGLNSTQFIRNNTGGSSSFGSNILTFSYASSTNIDHIRYDDGGANGGAYHFCADTTYGATGNASVYAASFYESGVNISSKYYHASNLPPSTGGGKVLQVVSYLTATQGSQTITTTDSIINNISKAITPVGTNSKFLVSVRWFGEMVDAWNVCFNVQMNGTRVNVDGNGRGYGLGMATQTYGVSGDNSSTPEILNIQTLVSTSSVIGTPITFRLVADANGSKTLWNNRCFQFTDPAQERGTSEIIITEIGA